jgi:radical SAM superfamily enzyme YgiQ (UPF0313 family)
MRAVLISTYDLGHQPFGLASPSAWLRDSGVDVRCVDLAKEKLPLQAVRAADLVAFHLPMHTATRLAVPVIERVRDVNPSARICAYGLYAPLNGEWLRSLGVSDLIGAEFEEELTRIAKGMTNPRPTNVLPRLQFRVPDRSGLPGPERYAKLHRADGTIERTGYTEASRGCRHLCRHCPVVPVYQGQFRIVQLEVVLADIEAQVQAGARHITFGDPDFFNGPTHAIRIVEAFADRHPALTYDVTIKIEHLLQHRTLLPRLRETGCLFVTSAVESLDDRTLAILEKGHTRADFLEAVALCRTEGLTLVPTFVPFHPWATLEDYCDLIDTIDALDLVGHVAPIQLAIRLLLPNGSRLLEIESLRDVLGPFDPVTLAYRWTHPDPRVDRLHAEVNTMVGSQLDADRFEVFDRISALAHERAGLDKPLRRGNPVRQRVPSIDEPWYCCAEPNPEQLRLV